MIDNENLEQSVQNDQEPVENNVQNDQASEEITPEKQQDAPKETFQAKNFRELREKALAIQRERDELARRLQEVESTKKQQISTQPDLQEDEIIIAPDELAEGKHLNKMAKEIKTLKNELKQYQQQSTVSSAESKLRSEFPDFEQVFSKDNIETLNMLHPEIAQTLDESKDVYRKAKSAYLFIKQMGIADNTYKQEKEIVQRNAAKPKPLASIAPQQGGDGALSRANAFANGLTPELQKQLYKEMMEARKQPR